MEDIYQQRVAERFGEDAQEDLTRPFVIIGKRGGRKIDAEFVADVIRKARNVVAYEKRLWYYDQSQHIYRRGDVDGELYDDIAFFYRICDGINSSTPNIRNFTDDVIHYLRINPSPEYPFGVMKGDIPVRNGVVRIDFKTGTAELLPYDKDVMSLWRLPITYDPKAEGNPIYKIFEKCVGGDDIELLYQIPAQAIIENWCIRTKDGTFRDALSPFRLFYILVGRQRSGKTSYQEILQRFFGSRTYSSVGLDRLGEGFGLSSLEGKLINLHDELKGFNFKDASRIKALTGGHQHLVEEKYRPAYVSRITAVHTFSTNTTPLLSDFVYNDQAFWERVYVVNFIGKFEINVSFASEITEEALSGFLNDVIKMIIHIVNTGSLPFKSDSEGAILSRRMWVSAMSDVSQFAREFLVQDPMDMSYSDFYNAYANWCWKEGRMPNQDPNFIIQSLNQAGIRTTRKADQRTYVVGVKVRSPQRKLKEGEDE